MRLALRMILWTGRSRLPAACAVLSFLLVGCVSPIGVNRISLQEANRALNANVLTTGKVGTDTNQFLARLDLSQRYQEDPVGTIAAIHSGLGQADESGRLFVLAELSFAYAQRTHNRAPEQSISPRTTRSPETAQLRDIISRYDRKGEVNS